MSETATLPGPTVARSRFLDALKRYWGYDAFRPRQEEIVRALASGRDVCVVMPTGGGKSLCYQLPAVLQENRTAVVSSPLTALMPSQLAPLRQRGIPAVFLNSAVVEADRRELKQKAIAGEYRLMYVSPERALMDGTADWLRQVPLSFFAIDEAHCISQWGHDFRPEYRQLATLKTRFRRASLHAYTATATERVRADIIEQLGLQEPTVLVGSFDRANLLYRVRPKLDVTAQITETLRRHKGEASIVYSISRKDTEHIAEYLRSEGIHAAHYHAGMEADERRATQDRFAAEEIDVVVATVAFGMGIDRSDIRCVIHAALPKSIEAYQQETGRAGRDSLPAECVLFYSAADVIRWRNLMERSAAESATPPEVLESGKLLLEEVRRFATVVRCRHAALSAYFGETYQPASCGACDFCLGEVEGVADSTVLAQKVLSCVARVEQRFGVEHVVDVLSGASSERVRRLSHEKLSTYGLLKDVPRKTLTNLVYQLVDAGLLERTPGDRPTLRLNALSWEVMRGRRAVTLLQAKATKSKRTRIEEESWHDVDEALFESLRKLRREIAAERSVPAYVILHDATRRELASVRPTTVEALRYIRGMGERKLTDFGARVVECIKSHQ